MPRRRRFLEYLRFLPSAEWIGWPLVLFVISCCFFASYATHRDLNADEGWQLDCAMRVLDGQLQHRDFESVYPAGRHYLFAGVLAITGKSLLAIRLLLCALIGISVGLVYAVGRRLMPPWLAWLAAALVMLAPGPWHKVFFSLILIVGSYLLLRWRESKRLRWLALTGVAGGIGAWFRQDNGLFVLFLALALVVLLALARRSRPDSGGVRRLLLEVTALLLPAACSLGLFFAFFAVQGAGSALLDQCFGVAMSENAPQEGVLFDALRLRVPGLGPASSRVVALLPFVMPLLAFPVLARAAYSAWRGRPIDANTAILFCLALSCLFAGLQVFRFDVLLRFLQCGPLVYLLGLALVWRLTHAAASRPWLSRAVLIGGCLLPLLLSAMVLFDRTSYRMPTEYTGSVAVRFQRRAPVDVRGTEFHFTAKWANPARRLVQFVGETTSPGEPLLVLGQPSWLYFLTDRLSPLPVIRSHDRAIGRVGRRDLEQTLLASGCRFVVEDRSLTKRSGRGWRKFLSNHCKVVGRVGKRLRVWEIVKR